MPSSLLSSDPFSEIHGEGDLILEDSTPEIIEIYLSETVKTVQDSDHVYETVWKSRECILMEIEIVLDNISIALANHEIPVLKVIKRNSDSAIIYHKDAVLLQGQLKIMNLTYGTERFEIYTSILKDIQEGLDSDVISKKR